MNNINNKQPLDVTDYDEISQPDVTTGNLSNSDEASTTIPIINPMGFLLGCVIKGENRGKQRPPTICKVSRVLRDHSESSFTPLLVSIGPIHRKDQKLQEFEWLKECYLRDLLKRCSKRFTHHPPEKTLEACLLKVNTLIPRIRESYGGMIDKYIDDEVATMMVMDGCFILEFCYKLLSWDLPNKMQDIRIAMDLLLLENQVPFFVLEALLDCAMGKEDSITLSYILDRSLAIFINIFRSDSLLPETTIHVDLDSIHETTDVDSDATHDHILGYLHKRYQLVAAEPPKSKLVAVKSSNPMHALKSKLVAAKSLNPIRTLILKLVAAKSLNPIRALKSKLLAAKSSNTIHTLKSKLVDKMGSKNTRRAFHSIVDLG